MARSNRTEFHLFNCDKLCKLSEVETLLKAVKRKASSQIKKHEFRGEQIEEIVAQEIPKLTSMDYAVFIVHAAEACLSFSDESGYGKIYEALKRRTGSDEKVLIVISGDKNYKSKSEEDQLFLSKWARDTISRQFRTHLVDGRKSFIFSWNQKHRPIHEEALLHYFDPEKKGQRFDLQTPTAATPKLPGHPPTPSHHSDIQQEDSEISVPKSADTEEAALQRSVTQGQNSGCQYEEDGEQQTLDVTQTRLQDSDENSGKSNLRRILKLQTSLRYGKISYRSADVETWDGSWNPPDSEVKKLEQEYKSTRVIRLTIFVDENDKICGVIVKPYTLRDYCTIS